MNHKIDFVITWVDGSDTLWQKEKAAYSGETNLNLMKWNDSDARYRDWELLPYWFRGVEKFAPWVNRIHFVTCGQVPSWLNTEHPKLNLVDHKDYIPEAYLPTFSSHCIELNLHRIPELEELFVYFNDDMFLTAPTQPETFFVDSLPADAAIISPVQLLQNGIRAEINDMYIINAIFQKQQVLKKNLKKWFHPVYGAKLIRTILSMPYRHFLGFYIHHCPTSFRKQTFEEVWSAVPEILDETCRHRFRTSSDVNQWLMQYWQYATGEFAPRNPSISGMYEGTDLLQQLCSAIRSQKFKMLCCNDSPNIVDFLTAKQDIQKAFQSILPEKSSFEK